MTPVDVVKLYEIDLDAVARDAMDGRTVVVFCDNQSQEDRIRRGVAERARSLGATGVTGSRRGRCVRVGAGRVRLVRTNGFDGRGLSADVAYLSESARMQHDLARLMGAEVR